jgi:hypothetical protein
VAFGLDNGVIGDSVGQNFGGIMGKKGKFQSE